MHTLRPYQDKLIRDGVTIGIYKITSPTGRIYIGQSCDVFRRFAQYKRMNCKMQPKLYASFKKYGVIDHEFEVLETSTVDRLSELETYYITKYGAHLEGHLNCRMDGIVNYHSDETKNKIREKLKGNKNTLGKKLNPTQIAALKKSNINRKLSPESIEKIRIGNIGRKMTEEERRKMSEGKRGKIYSRYKLVVNTETGIFYDTIKEAANATSYKETCLARMLRGERQNKTSFVYAN
jgi:group I intron endonuclease